MVTNNAVNIQSAGIVKYDGTSAFSAITTTQYNVLVGDTANGIASVAPSATTGYVLTTNGASSNPSFQMPGILQQVRVSNGNYSSSNSGFFPSDGTLPQQSEGDELLTLAITPISATSILEVNACFWLGGLGSRNLACALFRDAGTNAVSVAGRANQTTNPSQLQIFYYVVSGSTTTTTFKVRSGYVDNTTNGYIVNGYYDATRSIAGFVSYIVIREYSM